MAATSQSQTTNPFLLAADNAPSLLPLLRSDPSLASAQDDHGYSLLHAACSYNHLDLLRNLVTEFQVDINLVDEDGDTALFVAETLECAKILVEELHADISIRNKEGKTAREVIAEDDDFPQVAVYLRVKELEAGIPQTNGVVSQPVASGQGPPPPVPEGMSIQFGELVPEEELGEVVDLDFRRRIEELAARDDFQGEEGQRQLRELVTEALRGEVTERDVRRRTS